MPWWDKAISAGKEAAEKAAFEANKLVRIQNEERALSELRAKSQSKLADLGQLALTLYRNGTLTDPAFVAAAQEIAGLEAQLADQQATVEAVRADQYQPGQPAAPAPAPAAPTAPAYAVPPAAAVSPQPTMPAAAAVPPVSPAPAPTPPATVACPNCGAQVRSTAAFCPECGNKMK